MPRTMETGGRSSTLAPVRGATRLWTNWRLLATLTLGNSRMAGEVDSEAKSDSGEPEDRLEVMRGPLEKDVLSTKQRDPRSVVSAFCLQC